MAYTFPIELYTDIENSVGKEVARSVAISVERIASELQQQADILSIQKKAEIREELRTELASKADIALLKAEMNTLRAETKADIAALRTELKTEISELRAETRAEAASIRGDMRALEQKLLGEIKASEARLDRKFSILMVIMIVSVYLTNQSTISFVLRVFGILK